MNTAQTKQSIISENQRKLRAGIQSVYSDWSSTKVKAAYRQGKAGELSVLPGLGS